MFDYMSNISVKEKNATLAAHYIFRGFLNSMDAEDENCANFMFCEASQNAAKYGEVGKSIAKISRWIFKNYFKKNKIIFWASDGSGSRNRIFGYPESAEKSVLGKF